jgi:hypothetical protein
MTLYDFLLITLAALYVAEIFSREALAGPFGLLAWLRSRQKTGKLFACPYCLRHMLAGLYGALRRDLSWSGYSWGGRARRSSYASRTWLTSGHLPAFW